MKLRLFAVISMVFVGVFAELLLEGMRKLGDNVRYYLRRFRNRY